MPGAVGFIQTAGELLNVHPHIHLLITDGVFSPDGTFERFTHFDASLVERLFRAEVLRVLMGKGLISQEVVENLLSWPHSGFSYAQQDVMRSSSTFSWDSGTLWGLSRP